MRFLILVALLVQSLVCLAESEERDDFMSHKISFCRIQTNKNATKNPFKGNVLLKTGDKPVLLDTFRLSNGGNINLFRTPIVERSLIKASKSNSFARDIFDAGQGRHYGDLLYLVDGNNNVLWLRRIGENTLCSAAFASSKKKIIIVVYRPSLEFCDLPSAQISIYGVNTSPLRKIVSLRQLRSLNDSYLKGIDLIDEYGFASSSHLVSTRLNDIRCDFEQDEAKLYIFLNKENPSPVSVRLVYDLKKMEMEHSLVIFNEKGVPLSDEDINALEKKAVFDDINKAGAQVMALKYLQKQKRLKKPYDQSYASSCTSVEKYKLQQNYPDFAKKNEEVWKVVVGLPSRQKYILFVDKNLNKVYLKGKQLGLSP